MQYHDIRNEIVSQTRSRGEKVLCGPGTAGVDCRRSMRDGYKLTFDLDPYTC